MDFEDMIDHVIALLDNGITFHKAIACGKREYLDLDDPDYAFDDVVSHIRDVYYGDGGVDFDDEGEIVFDDDADEKLYDDDESIAELDELDIFEPVRVD
jgi:hypothetical protein